MSLKKTVLVVDDDPSLREVLKIIFEQAGYDVEIEKDGNELLNNNFSKPIIMISASPGIALQSKEGGQMIISKNHLIVLTF